MENNSEQLQPKATPDSRVTVIKDYYTKWYGNRFQNDKGEPLKPNWGPKQAVNCKKFILAWIDRNSISMDRALEVIDYYMQTQEEFIVKVNRSFDYLCQHFEKHYLEATKNKFVQNFSKEEKKEEKPKDPTDGMTWAEKRKYYDNKFEKSDDSFIRAYLEKAGPKFLKGTSWFPALRKMAPDSFRRRVWNIAVELWGEETCRKYTK